MRPLRQSDRLRALQDIQELMDTRDELETRRRMLEGVQDRADKEARIYEVNRQQTAHQRKMDEFLSKMLNFLL